MPDKDLAKNMLNGVREYLKDLLSKVIIFETASGTLDDPFAMFGPTSSSAFSRDDMKYALEAEFLAYLKAPHNTSSFTRPAFIIDPVARMAAESESRDAHWQQFWPSEKVQWPLLYIAAENILLGPSSQMGCERVHSVVRIILSRLRTSLGEASLEHLTLLSCVLRGLALDLKEGLEVESLIKDISEDDFKEVCKGEDESDSYESDKE